MTGENTIVGTVVEEDPDSPVPYFPGEGLYLLTEEGKLLALITAHMATQMPLEMLHAQSRRTFEQYIGKTVKIQGYISRRIIYSASVFEVLKNNDV